MINNVYKLEAYCQEMNVIEEHGREPQRCEPVNWKIPGENALFFLDVYMHIRENRIAAPPTPTHTASPYTHTHT